MVPRTVFDWSDPNDQGIIDSILPPLSTNLEFSQLLRKNQAKHGEFIEKNYQKVFGVLDSCTAYFATIARCLLLQSTFFHPCMLLLQWFTIHAIRMSLKQSSMTTKFRGLQIDRSKLDCNFLLAIFLIYKHEFYNSDISKNSNLCNFKNWCKQCQNGWKKSLDLPTFWILNI